MIAFLPPYVAHPLSGNGASFYGGILGDFGLATLAVSVLTSAVMTYRRHECHADRCHWPAWHEHDESGHPVCRRHHPDGKNRPHTIGGREW